VNPIYQVKVLKKKKIFSDSEINLAKLQLRGRRKFLFILINGTRQLAMWWILTVQSPWLFRRELLEFSLKIEALINK